MMIELKEMREKVNTLSSKGIMEDTIKAKLFAPMKPLFSDNIILDKNMEDHKTREFKKNLVQSSI